MKKIALIICLLTITGCNTSFNDPNRLLYEGSMIASTVYRLSSSGENDKTAAYINDPIMMTTGVTRGGAVGSNGVNMGCSLSNC